MKNLFMIATLLFTMTSWSQEHAFRDPATALKYRKDSLEAIKQRMLEIKEAKINNPTLDQTFDIEGLGSYILKFDLADKKGTVLNNRRREEITIDFNADQCIKKVSDYCEAYKRDLAQYEKDYNQKYKAKKIKYPTLDFDKLSYRLADGSGYNLNLEVATKSAPTELIQTASVQPTPLEQTDAKPKKKISSGSKTSNTVQ